MEKRSGFSLLGILLIVVITGIVCLAGWYVWNQQKDNENHIQESSLVLIEDRLSAVSGDFEFKTIATHTVREGKQLYQIRVRADQDLNGFCTYVLSNGTNRYEYSKKEFGGNYCLHRTSFDHLQPYGEWRLAIFYEGDDGRIAIGKKEKVNVDPELPKEELEIAAAFAVDLSDKISLSANLPTNSTGVCNFYSVKDRNTAVSDSAVADGSGSCTTDIPREKFSPGTWKLTVDFISDNSYIHARTNVLAERKFIIE